MIRRSRDRLIRRSRAAGFTLLEVLVALVIVGLGMIAVFEQLGQSLNAVARLRDKTFAMWIAEDRITALQANGEYPDVGERSDEIKMARASWTYTIKVSQIPDRELRRLDVTVSFADTPEDVLADLAGFVTAPPGRGVANPGDQGGAQPPPGNRKIGNGFGEGWEPAGSGVAQ